MKTLERSTALRIPMIQLTSLQTIIVQGPFQVEHAPWHILVFENCHVRDRSAPFVGLAIENWVLRNQLRCCHTPLTDMKKVWPVETKQSHSYRHSDSDKPSATL